ncbi:hepatocellular carcinoma down-regulated mitochondrial carrier protein [Aspergillus luchuensis]|uniref:Hepatocellular carcinoma down-regulated mitochondrial carrier protein n=1 Tax=Aspergillus kawachii TaxID=1069201 RepID=A0A146F4I5_ASPKA|nr:hepatocellular carcinoma down-regulated mitochondrial carrier protein [Aspergillus luchuensis]
MQDTVDRLDDAFRAPSPLLSRCVSCESPPPSGEVDCPLLDATLDEAIESLRNGEIASLHEAAVRYAVSDSLLYTRYYRKEPSQWPAPFGILYIVQWLQSGFPTSPHLVREAGNALHKRKCDSLYLNFKPLPQPWGRRFLEYHPQLKETIDSYTEDHKRTKQPQPDKISSFIDLFEKTRKQYDIHPDDIWNADEKGFMLEIPQGRTQKTIISKKSLQHKASRLLALSEDWVSTIECCNTGGRVLAPYVIFKGNAVESSRKKMIRDKKAQVGSSPDHRTGPLSWAQNSVIGLLTLGQNGNADVGTFDLLLLEHYDYYTPAPTPMTAGYIFLTNQMKHWATVTKDRLQKRASRTSKTKYVKDKPIADFATISAPRALAIQDLTVRDSLNELSWRKVSH